MKKLWSLITVPLMTLMLLGATVVKEFPQSQTDLATFEVAPCPENTFVFIEGYEPTAEGLFYEAAYNINYMQVVAITYTNDYDVAIWAKTEYGIEQFNDIGELWARFPEGICDLPDIKSTAGTEA